MKPESDCFDYYYACISGAFGSVYPIDVFLSYRSGLVFDSMTGREMRWLYATPPSHTHFIRQYLVPTSDTRLKFGYHTSDNISPSLFTMRSGRTRL